MSPDTAIDYLEQNVVSFQRHVVDRIIVAESVMDQVISSPSVRTDEDPELMLMVNDVLIRNSPTDKMSIPCGKFIVIKQGFNPMLAMEVLTRGDWVLADTDTADVDQEDPSDWSQQVSGLVDFLSASSDMSLDAPSFFINGNEAGTDTTTTESLILPGEDNHDDTEDTKATGGFALYCRTKSHALEAAAIFTANESAVRTIETEGGLVIHADEGQSTETVSRLKRALVLPFDMDLWTATMMLNRGAE